MTDIHEKPIYNDEFVEIRPFFEDDEIDYYRDDEPPEYPEGSWDDGYPDELIPEHASLPAKITTMITHSSEMEDAVATTLYSAS